MRKVGGQTKDQATKMPIDVINMYFKLIPKAWGLGDGENPEKWFFSVASDSLVIRAKPLGLVHNSFPVAVSSPDYDGYSPTSISRIEILSGLQEILDWMLNSHVANVRKAINDMIIVDPYLVNMKDLKDPKPGKLIRLRRPAWGRGVDKVAQQLQVNDITRANIGDAGFIMKFMDQVVGSDNPLMGNLRSGGPERLSAREFQGTMSGAISRLERVARVIGLQAFQDIGYMFAAHTQQLMSRELYVKTTGRWEQQLRREYGVDETTMKVSPFDVLIDYDVLVRDGSVPGGNFSDVWVQMFQVLASNPELMQQFDIPRIFKFIARNLGAKNVEEFERKMPPMGAVSAPDEIVEEEATKGNLVAIGGR
jgi:hypothetical protein